MKGKVEKEVKEAKGMCQEKNRKAKEVILKVYNVSLMTEWTMQNQIP